MTSLGGSIFLLCLAVCGVIMSSTRWVRILSFLYLGWFGILTILQIVREKWDPYVMVMLALLSILALYASAVQRAADPKDEGKE